jgi:hypothetical protein
MCILMRRIILHIQLPHAYDRQSLCAPSIRVGERTRLGKLGAKLGDMGKGESGIGWSMPIYPRNNSVQGQDQKYFPHKSRKRVSANRIKISEPKKKSAQAQPPKPADKINRKPPTHRDESAVRQARGRAQPAETRMKGVLVKKVVRESVEERNRRLADLRARVKKGFKPIPY